MRNRSQLVFTIIAVFLHVLLVGCVSNSVSSSPPFPNNKPNKESNNKAHKKSNNKPNAKLITQPNILFIIADDVTWRDFGFTGNSDVATPHLDQLAKEGVQLSNVFSSSSTCSPTRHALLTGQYPVKSGAYPNHSRVYSGTSSLFTYANQLGYRSALQGKTHIGPAASFPFERLAKGNIENFAKTHEFITREPEQPWLLVFASNEPHDPWTKGNRQLHDPERLSVPAYLHDNKTTRQSLAAYYREINLLDQQVGRLINLLKSTEQYESTLIVFVSEQGSAMPYGGKWSLYDNGIRAASVIRMPNKIRPETGRETTVSGNTKSALIQYIDFVPTVIDIVLRKAVLRNSVSEKSASVESELANSDTSMNLNGLDGQSFYSLLTSNSDGHRSHVFSQQTTVGIKGYKNPYPMRAVRDARYKYIRNLAAHNEYYIEGIHSSALYHSWESDAKNNPKLKKRLGHLSFRPEEELYDLALDPLEERNLASDISHVEIKNRLRQSLSQWMESQGDQGIATELSAHERQSIGRWRRNQQLATEAFEDGDVAKAIHYLEIALQKKEGLEEHRNAIEKIRKQLRGYQQQRQYQQQQRQQQ